MRRGAFLVLLFILLHKIGDTLGQLTLRLLLDDKPSGWAAPGDPEGAGLVLDHLAVVRLGGPSELSGAVTALARGGGDGMVVAVLGEAPTADVRALATQLSPSGRDGTAVLRLRAGAGLALLGRSGPRGLRSLLYVVLGMVSIPVIPRLPDVIGPARAGWLVFGALIYALGAWVYARRWPDPLPTVFGYHEVFHLMVIAGASVHYAVILDVLWGAG